MVDKLLHKLKHREEVTIFDQNIVRSPNREIFQKTLTLIKNYFPTETITQIVVTLRKWTRYC